MKNLMTIFSSCCLLMAAGIFFTGCGLQSGTDENVSGKGDFALEIKEVGADFVELAVTAPAEVEMAYLIDEEPLMLSPAVLFATGETMTVSPGEVIKLTKGLFQNSSYRLYAVAKLDVKNYSRLVELEFETKSYEFDDLITIVETYYDGYKAHITVPQETIDRGHVIRASSMPLALYNLKSSAMGTEAFDLQMIGSMGDPYSGHIFKDSTIVIGGDGYAAGEPIAPGEPTLIYAGECRYGSKEEFSQVMGYYQPERDSWSVPYFDRSTWSWLGAFQKKEFFTKEPSLCDATVEIDIPEDEITVTDAMIYFEMSDDAYSYFYIVLDNSTYNQILSTYLNGNEDWYRWFLTSYIGFYEWGIFPETENIAVNAASSFVEPLTGGETYHVLVTVFGDEDGATQRFIHKTFKAKDKTKVAPVIDVTAIESSDPYSVTFNIKAGADSKGNVQPIMGAFWVCNYARDFELMFNADYTYATLLKNMGWTFSSEEIAQVNSPEGLTVTFPTLDGEVTRFAAYGCNDEYTFNVIDEEHTAGWADCKSPLAESVAPVSSELFTLLEGDWTASAKLRAMQQEPDGSILTYHVDHKSKINISASAPELPATLDESVYGLYAGTPEKPGKSKEDVDNMFEELKELSDLFTESRLVGQNRLLCSGFMDFDPAAPQLGVNRLEFRSPYDLFVATDYSSVDVSQLIYDFGPKWFLQIQEDGSVIVPFHSMMLPPMSNWPGYAFYTGGVADGMAFYDSNESYPGFPVEISDDLNTITIKPIVLNDGATDYYYYMNAIGVSQQGGLEIISTVITDIVLKRGWTETAAASSKVACSASANSVTAINMDGSYVNELPKAVVCKSMTEFKAQELPSYTRKEKANVVTKEMVDETSAKILRKYNLQ